MIDSVEPLSCVLWLVTLFAAGMYPLGFMLGAPCSPCCGDNCEDVFDFNRCIRFVNNDQTAPPETIALTDSTIGPLHGFSFPVTRPSQVGAQRVPTKIVAGFTLAIRNTASSMSDGETQTEVYRFLYGGLGDAIKWTITLQGVTMPLSPPQSLNNALFLTPNHTPRTVADYMITRRAINTNVAPSVSVHSCSVVSGVQWLDGNAVTEHTLKSMMTHTIFNDPFGIRAISARSLFSLNTSVFRYVPKNSSVVLRYVIEHARGNTRRYATQQITIRNTVDADEIPESGLAPLVIAPTPYEDTPFTRTPPVFAGDTSTTMTATIYTDNVFSSESVTVELAIALPSVELFPAGVELQNLIGLQFTEPAGDPAPFMYTNQPPYVELSEFRWIMAPALGIAPYAMSNIEGGIFRANNTWIYDYDLVESFLNGETTLPYDTTANTSYTMQVSALAKYCGQALHGRTELNSAGAIPHVTPADTIERVVTCRLSPPPASANWDGAVEDMPLKLGYRVTFFANTDYYGQQYQCYGLNNTNRLERQIAMRAFYCGDLLWVLENGPCRTTLTKPYAHGWEPDEFALGGDYTLPSVFGTLCPNQSGAPPTTVREITAPRQGGVISVEVPNPPDLGPGTFIRNYSVPENFNTYDLLYHAPVDGYTYITQAGYGTECRFRVEWLANADNDAVLGLQFESDRCPIWGQVEHFQPSLYGSRSGHTVCDWSVTSSADWLIAEKVSDGPEEGLLKLSIDFTVEAIFNEISNTRRSAIITVISGGTTNTWTIRHSRT